MPLVAGVDSSAGSTTIEVRDAETGRSWGAGKEPHPPTAPPCSEQDPGAWWAALVQAFHRVGRYNVAGLSVAGQQHGLVALDAARAVIRPAKLRNDTESSPQAAGLVAALGAEKWARACGSVPTAAFTVTKLAWLRATEPEAFARLAHVLLPHDWLTWRLTGRFVTDRGDASGTGYWSPAEGRWRTDLLSVVDPGVDWQEALPLVLTAFEPAGPLSAGAALPLGLDGIDVTVAPGTGDNMAAALAVGLRPGDVMLSLGTSGSVSTVTEHPVADATGAIAGFADATGRFLPLVGTVNAAKVSATFARLLGVGADRFDALALSAPPGAGGVVLVPFDDGEGTLKRPPATGVLTGLRSELEAAQVARAAVEGVVCALLDGLDALAGAGLDVGGRLFLVGGTARSGAYRRIVADLAGRPVMVPDPATDLVAAGACIQAAAVLLRRPPGEVAEAWGLGRGEQVDPDEKVDANAIRAAYAAVRG